MPLTIEQLVDVATEAIVEALDAEFACYPAISPELADSLKVVAIGRAHNRVRNRIDLAATMRETVDRVSEGVTSALSLLNLGSGNE